MVENLGTLAAVTFYLPCGIIPVSFALYFFVCISIPGAISLAGTKKGECQRVQEVRTLPGMPPYLAWPSDSAVCGKSLSQVQRLTWRKYSDQHYACGCWVWGCWMGKKETYMDRICVSKGSGPPRPWTGRVVMENGWDGFVCLCLRTQVFITGHLCNDGICVLYIFIIT